MMLYSEPHGFHNRSHRRRNGRADILPQNSIKRDDLTVIKASCCLPAVCKPIVIDGKDCFDGGISDPIPFQKAFDMGCDKVIVVISKPVDFRKSPQKHMPIIKAALKNIRKSLTASP